MNLEELMAKLKEFLGSSSDEDKASLVKMLDEMFPKKETLTSCWVPNDTLTVNVFGRSCKTWDRATNGKPALIASRSSGSGEKKSKSTDCRWPSRKAMAVPP